VIALIDGDLVVHVACAAQQITGDFGDGLGETVMYDEEEAVVGANRLIHKWTKSAGAKSAIVCFSGNTNFRKIIYPEYKANRLDMEKPKAFLTVRQEIELEYESWAIDGLEADDIMGIAGSRDPGNYIVVSTDKDMMTIPGRIFNPDHHKKPVRVRKDVADQIWLKQAMTGDSVDNYPGIKGVGEARAQEIIQNPHLLEKKHGGQFQRGKKKGQKKPDKWVKGVSCSVWESMKSYARKADQSEEELITMARLARILRSGEFDTENRVVYLWNPKGKTTELYLDDA